MTQDEVDKIALEKFEAFIKDNEISLKVSKPIFSVNDDGLFQQLEPQRVLIGGKKVEEEKDDVEKETVNAII